MPKKPKSLVGPLKASDTRVRPAKKAPAPPDPNKPKVFILRAGTANQLGPAKGFTTDAALKKAAGEFFQEAIPWANRFEKAAVERIDDAVMEVGRLPELKQINQPHRVECLIDSYTGTTRVVELRKIRPPAVPVQQTIIK